MIRTLVFCLKSLKTITKGYNLSIKKYKENEIMNKLEQLLKQIKLNPEKIEFQQVITVIEEHYSYTPTQFINGSDNDCIINKAGKNEGSCKIFSFALDQHLDETQTLHCFGQYFRNDVLNYPENTDHSNIRNFMKYGWKGITFEASALNYKEDP